MRRKNWKSFMHIGNKKPDQKKNENENFTVDKK